MENTGQGGREMCQKCGTTARQPGLNGLVLHRFVKGEHVISTAGMAGTVLRIPKNARHAEGVGYRVRWENDTESNVRAASLDHFEDHSEPRPVGFRTAT